MRDHRPVGPVLALPVKITIERTTIMTHLIITLPSGQLVERWTGTPETTERFYRDAGAYVLEGGVPQPVYSDDQIDTTSAFPSRR